MTNLINTMGVDLSSNNGNISDFSVFTKNGYKWAMLRLGYGSNDIRQDDTRIFDYAEKCAKSKIPFGVYLISYSCCQSDSKSEIEHAKRVINALVANGYNISLPVAIDIEPLDYTIKNGGYNPDNINFLINLWNTQIRQFGYLPMAYIGFSEWNMLNENNRKNTNIWWAQWYTQCDYPGNPKKLGIWQFGGETNYLKNPIIPGAGICDQNIMYVDYLSYLYKTGLSGYKHLKPSTNDKPILDSYGYKNGDSDLGSYAFKQLLQLAHQKGILKNSVDRKSSTIGTGSIKCINEFLAANGYKANSIAGVNFIKRLSDKIFEKEQ